MSNKLETLNVQGTITATSNKVNPDFVNENPQKSVYFELDTTNTALAEKFGLRKYTSKKDGKDFFIVKTSAKVTQYNGSDVVKEWDGSVNSNNFNTPGVVNLAIMKGKSKGNEFFRLYAVQGEMEEIVPVNPFADAPLPF